MNAGFAAGEPVNLGHLAAGRPGYAGGLDVWLYEGPLTQDAPFSYPIRFDSILFLTVHSGRATLHIDLREYALEADTLVMLRPQNFVTGFDVEEPLEVSAVSCSRNVQENFVPTLSEVLPIVMRLSVNPVMPVEPAHMTRLRLYFDLMKRLMECSTGSPYLNRKLGSVFKAAAFEVAECHDSALPCGQGSRAHEIVAEFLRLLMDNFRSRRDVAFYAGCMHITPKHLSAVLKSTCGRTAGEWIENYVVLEAKLLLSQTSLSIQEISYALNFSSQAFFGKYFRNATGMSPSAWRKGAIARGHGQA